MSFKRAIRGLSLSVLFAVGCGGGPPFAPVSGKVTLDGQPLANATLTFQPIAEKAESGPSSYGRTDAGGNYSLKEPISGKNGAGVGQYQVQIMLVDDSGAQSDSASAAPPSRRLPEKYNTKSELKFEVKPGGSSQANFDLKSS